MYFGKHVFVLFNDRDDLERAIKKLHALGSGFQVIPVGNKRLVQSVPGELTMDDTATLQLAQVLLLPRHIYKIK
jgi:ESCRT-II complex subunit VPS22